VKAVAPRRPGGKASLVPAAIAAGAVVILVVLWVLVRNLSIFGPEEPSMAGLVAVPTPARAIPAYTRVTRDHFWNPATGQLAVVYLPPQAVTKEMLTRLPDVLGRVLNHDKAPGYVFTDADFMPDGTREGLVAGIPAGKRAIRIPADVVDGLFGLNSGDRFDLVATMPIDEGRAGGGQAFDFGGVFADQLALEARLSNWQKQATVQVLAQNGVIVEAMTTRQIPVVQTSVAEGARTRTRPVQEVVIAVEPTEVAQLTEAMAVGAKIWMVPRSGRPDDPMTSKTPELRPVSPFSNGSGSRGEGSYKVVETIMGQRRELTAVPKP
jgi:Flp pilus assembly protein CpaB